MTYKQPEPKKLNAYYGQIKETASNLRASLREASAYEIDEIDFHISKVNELLVDFSITPEQEYGFYLFKLNQLIDSLNSDFKSLASEINANKAQSFQR